MSINGFLGGLVAITAPCYWVNPTGAFIIGAVAGILVPLATDLIEHLRIDDPVGAVPVHRACGIWGTLAVGLFATGEYGIPTSTGADNANPVDRALLRRWRRPARRPDHRQPRAPSCARASWR